MIVDQRVTIPAPPERIWTMLMDVPAVSRCVPGIESIDKLDDDHFAGTMKVKVGPVALTLGGKVAMAERDRDNWTARLEMRAADKRIPGSVTAKVTLRLEPRGDQATELAIHTDAAILGKLGEFGQAVMLKKADQILDEFARCLARQVGAAAPTGGD